MKGKKSKKIVFNKEKMVKGFKEKFKNMNFGMRLGIIIAVIVSLALFTCNFIVLKTYQSKYVEATRDSYSALAAENSANLYNTVNEAVVTSRNISSFIENNYDLCGGVAGASTKYMSAVNGAKLTKGQTEVENYLLNSGWSTIQNSTVIKGIGLYFEQKKFNPMMKNYSFYINEEDAKSRKVSQQTISYDKYSELPAYKNAKELKAVCVSDPYEKNGEKVISVSVPFMVDGRFIGVAVADISVKSFDSIISNSDDHVGISAISQNGVILFHSQYSDLIGHSLNEIVSERDAKSLLDKFNTEDDFYKDVKNASGNEITVFSISKKVANKTWRFQTTIPSNYVTETSDRITREMILVSIVLIILVVVILNIIIRKSVKPIYTIVDAAEEIKSGNFEIDVKITNNDEFGKLAGTFNDMASETRAIINDIKIQLDKMSTGDFTVGGINGNIYVGDYKEILQSINMINTRLSSTLSEIDNAQQLVFSHSEQVSASAQILSEGATEQAASVEELSATINTVADNVEKNAEYSKVAKQIVDETGIELEESNNQMNNMQIAMREISETNSEISKIIKTIDDIAFQTNILALNASVEAARAGDAGRGFAVVADEVRKLAEKSASAAKNTTELIESAVTSVKKGSRLADLTANSLNQVMEMERDVVSKVDEITAATEHQSSQIAQINTGIEQISTVVMSNSASAEESAATAEELTSQSEILKNLIEEFKLN